MNIYGFDCAFQALYRIGIVFLLCTTSAYAEYDLTKLKNYSFNLERTAPARSPFLACYKKDGRELCYIGTNHEINPQSPTFDLIEKTIEAFKPDFLVIEGFETQRGLSPSDIISTVDSLCKVASTQCGEIHHAVALAKAKNIPFLGGEPDDEEVYDKLRSEGYTKNDVFAFYFARLVPQFYREKQIKNIDDLHKKYDEVLKMNRIEGVTLTYPEYVDWIKRYVLSSFELSEMVNPKFVAPLFNGQKLQQIADKIEWIRDKHILRTIFDSLLKYKRVLVVYGHSHFLTQVDVLEDRFGKPQYLEKYVRESP